MHRRQIEIVANTLLLKSSYTHRDTRHPNVQATVTPLPTCWLVSTQTSLGLYWDWRAVARNQTSGCDVLALWTFFLAFFPEGSLHARAPVKANTYTPFLNLKGAFLLGSPTDSGFDFTPVPNYVGKIPRVVSVWLDELGVF